MSQLLKISVKIDDGNALAIESMPSVLREELEPRVDGAGKEVAREMRAQAPKAFSTLMQSIKDYRDGVLSRFVGPHVNYALHVVTGTGPAAGKPSYFPNPYALAPWVKQHSGIRFGTTKAGSAGRKRLYDEIRDRSWALARHIATVGTKPNPFVDRTFEVVGDRIEALLQEGVDASIARLAHGGSAA
jgi:hypothetical protein